MITILLLTPRLSEIRYCGGHSDSSGVCKVHKVKRAFGAGQFIITQLLRVIIAAEAIAIKHLTIFPFIAGQLRI